MLKSLKLVLLCVVSFELPIFLFSNEILNITKFMFNNLKKYYINQLSLVSLYSNLHTFRAFEQFIWNLRSIHSLLIKVDSLFHQELSQRVR
jgi:hypothetical protein